MTRRMDLTIVCPLCEGEVTLEVVPEPDTFYLEAKDEGHSTCLHTLEELEASPKLDALVWQAIEGRYDDDYDRYLQVKYDRWGDRL